jgi:hypothetical protein
MTNETLGADSARASTVVNDRATLFALAESLNASKDDRKFFEKFPERRHRLRSAFASEMKLAGVQRTRSSNAYRAYVAVCQLAPGVWFRIGFLGLRVRPGLGEGESATLFDAAMKQSRAVPEIIRTIIRERGRQ